MSVQGNTGAVYPQYNAVKQAAEALVEALATPIDNPNAEYLNRTTKIDISGLPFNSSHTSITDGTLTVTFSAPVIKRGPVPDGWATWSSPPFSEDPNPDVLYAAGLTSLTLDLSRSVQTFGFELEPSPFAVLTYTADFYADGNLVESITRAVDGNAGARLFARTGTPINRVVITGPAEFAIAQIRYELALSPEQITFFTALLLVLAVILAVILLA